LKFGFENGSQPFDGAQGTAEVSLNGVSYRAKVLLDESISTGVVLIPRSFGIPIKEPVAVKLTALEKAQEA
jgi:hypothetical protein